MSTRIPQIDWSAIFAAIGAEDPNNPDNFSRPEAQLDILPTAALGANRTSFIFNDGHQSGIGACGLYNWVGGAPSTNAFKAEEWRINAQLKDAPKEHVGTNYEQVIPKLLEKYGERLVVVITLPTHLHANAIIFCANAGVKFIITDKPVTVTMEEFEEVSRVCQDKGVTVLVTFNHIHNAPMRLLRKKTVAEIHMKGGASVSGESAFNQDWVASGVENWRVLGADPLDPNVRVEGVADIMSHAAHGLSYVAGFLPFNVTSAKLGRQGNHGFLIYDHGNAHVEGSGGFKGRVSFTQVDYAGERKDDYYVRINFHELGESWMYRMWWSPDGILRAPIDTHTDDRAVWTAHGNEFLRGHSLYGDINAIFSNPPAGHIEAWKSMWEVWYAGASREILERLGSKIIPGLPAKFHEQPTTLEDGGRIAQQFVADVIAAHEGANGDPFVEEREALAAKLATT